MADEEKISLDYTIEDRFYWRVEDLYSEFSKVDEKTKKDYYDKCLKLVNDCFGNFRVEGKDYNLFCFKPEKYIEQEIQNLYKSDTCKEIEKQMGGKVSNQKIDMADFVSNTIFLVRADYEYYHKELPSNTQEYQRWSERLKKFLENS